MKINRTPSRVVPSLTLWRRCRNMNLVEIGNAVWTDVTQVITRLALGGGVLCIGLFLAGVLLYIIACIARAL